MTRFDNSVTLPITGMSESELAESNKFWDDHGITVEMVNKNVELTRQLMCQHLKELVKGNQNKKYWVYYFLGELLFAGGQFEEAAATYSSATQEYPNNPRAWYSLGTIYYGMSQAQDTEKNIHRADLKSHPIEIQQLTDRISKFEEKNQQFLKTIRESKLVKTPGEAANLALHCFQKAMACNIATEDWAKIQRHIQLIEIWKKHG